MKHQSRKWRGQEDSCGLIWGLISFVALLCFRARGSYFVSTNKLKPFAKGRLADNSDVLAQFWSFLFPPTDEDNPIPEYN